jgi:hypothetical protein
MDFDMVDYDARKVFAYMKVTGFCASNPPYNPSVSTHSRYAAPSTGGFIGNSPKGRGREPHFARRTGKSFLANPDKTARAQEISGIGRISFGYFSLSAQRKVSRLPVRELALKSTVALATL